MGEECVCGDFLPRVSCDCRLCGRPYPRNSPKVVNARMVAYLQAAHTACAPVLGVLREFDADRAGSAEELRAALAESERRCAEALRVLAGPELGALAEREAALARRRRRQMVMEEIADTEQQYMLDLETTDVVWKPAAVRAGFLTPAEAHVLFGTIPQLRFLAGEMARELRDVRDAPPEEQLVGEIFLKKAPFFRLYIEHCGNQSAASEILARVAGDPRCIEFKRRMRAEPATKQLELSGFLIKPTQRITKYPLLLRDLLRYTDPSHPDHANLLAAADALLRVITEVNEKTRQQESFDALTRLQPSIVWRGAPRDLVAAKCTVVRSGKLVCFVIPKSDAVKEPLKGNYVLLLNLFVLVMNERPGTAGAAGSSRKLEEVSCFSVSDILLKEDPPAKAVAPRKTLEFSVRGEASADVIMTCADSLERQHWVTSIRDAISTAPKSPRELPREAPAPRPASVAARSVLDVSDMGPAADSGSMSDKSGTLDSAKDLSPPGTPRSGAEDPRQEDWPSSESSPGLGPTQPAAASGASEEEKEKKKKEKKHHTHRRHGSREKTLHSKSSDGEPISTAAAAAAAAAADEPVKLKRTKRASLHLLMRSSTNEEDADAGIVCASARGSKDSGWPTTAAAPPPKMPTEKRVVLRPRSGAPSPVQLASDPPPPLPPAIVPSVQISEPVALAPFAEVNPLPVSSPSATRAPVPGETLLQYLRATGGWTPPQLRKTNRKSAGSDDEGNGNGLTLEQFLHDTTPKSVEPPVDNPMPLAMTKKCRSSTDVRSTQ